MRPLTIAYSDDTASRTAGLTAAGRTGAETRTFFCCAFLRHFAARSTTQNDFRRLLGGVPLAMRGPASKNSTLEPPELRLYSTVGTQKRTECWKSSSPAV